MEYILDAVEVMLPASRLGETLFRKSFKGADVFMVCCGWLRVQFERHQVEGVSKRTDILLVHPELFS